MFKGRAVSVVVMGGRRKGIGSKGLAARAAELGEVLVCGNEATSTGTSQVPVQDSGLCK